TGKLIPELFPAIFGPGQDQPLDASAVHAAFDQLATDIGDGRSAEQVADGFIQIANAAMAEAIKKISVQRGYDITRYALNSFGGAGGQHACLVADALGMTRVMIHPYSGLLSAYGMGLAEVRAQRQTALDVPLDNKAPAAVARTAAPLRTAVLGALATQGVDEAQAQVAVRAHIRYSGTDTSLPVAAGTLAEMKQAFEDAHRRRFGFTDEDKQIVIEAIEVEAIGGGAQFEEAAAPVMASDPPKSLRPIKFFSQGQWCHGHAYMRDTLRPGHRIAGPAIIIEPNQTVVVEPGWQAQLTALDHLVLERTTPAPKRVAVGTSADPVMLEIFNNLFMSIAEQMGVTLQNTAY